MNTRPRLIDFTLLFTRAALGTVIAAHGAQKLLGWFGGGGFEGTMEFFTKDIGLPYFAGVLVILAESLGMVALVFGFLSRMMSASVIVIIIGALVTTHLEHGFFMNWFGTQSGEGYEFDILVIALSFVTLLNGPGVYSLDHVIQKKLLTKDRQSTQPSIG